MDHRPGWAKFETALLVDWLLSCCGGATDSHCWLMNGEVNDYFKNGAEMSHCHNCIYYGNVASRAHLLHGRLCSDF